jgi:hypothetical protein
VNGRLHRRLHRRLARRGPARPRLPLVRSGRRGIRVSERFDVATRRIIALAAEEALRAGHRQVGPEQLLLSLAEWSAMPAEELSAAGATAAGLRGLIPATGGGHLAPLDAEALASLGIDLDTVSRASDAAFGPGSLNRAKVRQHGRRHRPGPARLAAASAQAIELAQLAARRMGHRQIAPGHLLLGLLDQPASPAVSLLRAAGVDIAALRTRVQHRLLDPGPPGPAGAVALA